MKKLIRKSALLLSLLFGGCTVSPAASANELRVCFFNAGKADAILLYTDDSAVLIDCGESDFGDDILAYMKKAGIDHLDKLIITHFDKDHVGGASAVLNGTEVSEVLVSNYPKDSDEYNAFVQALAAQNLSAVTVTGAAEYSFVLDGTVYTVDGPDQETYASNPSNNSSLIISAVYGGTSFLFAGDAQNERIEEYLQDHTQTFDVLKVPYHGNYQKKLKELLAVSQPSAAVITCSSEEGGEEKALQLLEAAGIQTYLTWQGEVTVTSDGKTLSFNR